MFLRLIYVVACTNEYFILFYYRIISHYVDTPILLSINQLIAIYDTCTSCVTNNAVKEFVVKFLHKNAFSFLLSIYLEVKILGHTVIPCLTF